MMLHEVQQWWCILLGWSEIWWCWSLHFFGQCSTYWSISTCICSTSGRWIGCWWKWWERCLHPPEKRHVRDTSKCHLFVAFDNDTILNLGRSTFDMACQLSQPGNWLDIHPHTLYTCLKKPKKPDSLTMWERNADRLVSRRPKSNRRLKPGAIPVLVVTALGFKNDLGNKCEGSKEIASILLLFYKMALLLHGDTQMLTLTFDKLLRIVFVAVLLELQWYCRRNMCRTRIYLTLDPVAVGLAGQI